MPIIIDDTYDDLRWFVEQDFGPIVGDLQDRTVLDWLHYRARLIPVRPRQVIVSSEVAALRAAHPAIGEIEARLRIGGEVAPWLSERIRRRKEDHRADEMFNDWQVSHFHLGRYSMLTRKVDRTGLLLFCYIKAERAVLLDVKPHRAWTSIDLLRILLRESPNDLPEMRGILPSETPWTDEQIAGMRKAGMVAPIIIDGRTFVPPGIGMVSSRHALRLRMYADRLRLLIRETIQQVEQGTLEPAAMRKIVGQIGLPVRLGLSFHEGAFGTYDKNRMLGLLGMRAIE